MAILNRISDGREAISDLAWKWRCKILPVEDDVEKRAKSKTLATSSLSDEEDIKEKSIKKEANATNASISTKAKFFYEGRLSRPESKFFDWQNYPPKQASAAAIKTFEGWAIHVYKIKDRSKQPVNGRHQLTYHSIVVQNLTLIQALEPILKKENVLVNPQEPYTFEAPFQPLFFCWSDIAALHKTTDAQDPSKTLLELLLQILEDVFGDLRLKVKRMRESQLVSYKLAWSYFPKDTPVYTFARNTDLACRIEGTEYTFKGLLVKARMLQFNGSAFVWESQSFLIPSFEGNKPIQELQWYPLEFHKDIEGVKRRLGSRGERVLDLQGLCYREYNGIAMYSGDGSNDIERHNVEGRVLIDVVGYNKYHRAKGPREDHDPNSVKNTAAGPTLDGVAQSVLMKTETTDDKRGLRCLSEEDQKRNKEKMLEKREELIFMSPVVEGYALKNKRWMLFFIEDIRPMRWNRDAFQHLVYDEQQKDLVLSFVENHGRTNASLDDVIRGKGQGLVMLLSGPPGTGKTLTAEAVADKTQRPLFYLQAEDLGVSAATLGANVKRVFEMATDWDAVILLDEADVFMAERDPNDIMRNELVSIFLRELEYFRGIIFLTTNMYNTIDTAFRSRVNLHLLFRALPAQSRELVWRKFLHKLQRDVLAAPGEKKGISDSDIKELGLWTLNGREIKNVVKMTMIWCDNKDYELTLERMENGIRVTNPHASKEGQGDGGLYD